MGLFNVFSDPQLVARQQQLDGQWSSLWATFQGCNNTPDSAFAEFATDRKNWQDFYVSGSDWSADSKKATDDWQEKAQEWAGKLASWGCTGNSDSASQSGASGIPTIKDPPPDAPSVIDQITGAATKPLHDAESYLSTIGWVAVGLVVLIIAAIVYLGTHAKVEGAGVKVG